MRWVVYRLAARMIPPDGRAAAVVPMNAVSSLMPFAIMTAVLLVAVGAIDTGWQADQSGRRGDVRVLELTSVRRLFDATARPRASADEGERVAAWADLSLLLDAVAGEPRAGSLAPGDLEGTPLTPAPRIVVTPAVARRDTAAYQLLSLGYSARETADVVSGRITKEALDTAQKMLMVGRGRDEAANYLDTRYKRVEAMRRPPAAAPGLAGGASRSTFDAVIERAARLHGVDPILVGAIIGVESAFDPRARSGAGAIGLMQLMPATARALGVDPWLPEQNIEGGVRYLSELLKMFGSVELALVAYNGGPGYAWRYSRGEAALYGETRDYVKRVLAAFSGRR